MYEKMKKILDNIKLEEIEKYIKIDFIKVEVKTKI